MLDKLLSQYIKSVEHISFILRMKREETLLIANNRFSKNLLKARMARFMASTQGHATTIYNSDGGHAQAMVCLEKLSKLMLVDNLEHIINDIHNILRAYYEITCKHFIN